MCGRGGHDYSWKQVYDYLNLAGEPPDGGLQWFNVAPSTRRGDEVNWTRLPVAVQGAQGRELRHMIWPLIPPWLKGELPKFSTANCRSESDRPFSQTVARKPTFRNAWKQSRRCLVPFSWFYEWDQRGKPKQPWRVMPVGEPMFVMAGLWEQSVTAAGEERESFTLVTTDPNQLLRDIGHHRAPVIPEPEEWDSWLAGSPEEAESVIHPPADGRLSAEPVTVSVNNPQYQGEELKPASGTG